MTLVPKLPKLAACALLGLLWASVPPALAATDCESALREAHDSYDLGRFEAVPGELAPCLHGKVSRQETVQANALLAKAFLAADREKDARVAIARLLKADPAYEPDEPPLFVRMVKEARRLVASRQVASVSKTAETLREAPATVEVITSGEIRRRGYLDLEQVLHDLPGFDISRDNGQVYSSFYQRGFRSNNNDRNLLLVDGMEQNDLASNVVYLSRQYPLSNVDRVEVLYGPAATMYGANAYTGVINIITKDPEDLIPEGRLFGYAGQAGGGSFATRFADVSVAGRDGSGAVAWSLTSRAYRSSEMDLSRFQDWDYDYTTIDYAARLTLTGTEAGRFVRNCGGCDPSLYTVTRDGNGGVLSVAPTAQGVRLALARDQALLDRTRSRFGDETDDRSVEGRLRIANLTLGFQLWQLREGVDPWYTESLIGGRGDANVWEPRQASFFFRTSRALSSDLSLNLYGRYLTSGLSSRRTFLSTYAGGGFDLLDLAAPCTRSSCLPTSTVVTSSESSSQFRTDVSLVYQPLTRLSAVGGVELRRGSIEGVPEQQADGAGTLFSPVHSEHTDVGVYAQGTYALSPRLKLVAGARLDHSEIHTDIEGASTGFGSLVSTRAAVVYSPRADLVLKAIYSDGFKDPSDFEKLGTFSTATASDLRPETVQNGELAAVWEPNPQLSLTGSAYQARYHKVVTQLESVVCFAGTACLPVSTLSNGAEYRIRGIQAGGRYHSRSIDIDGNYTLTQPFDLTPRGADGELLRNANGDVQEARIPDIARHRVNLGLSLPLGAKLDVSLRGEYVSVRTPGPSTKVQDRTLSAVAATFLAHAAVSLEVLPGTALQLIVRNVFDRSYYDPGVQSADGTTFAGRVPQPGRTVYLRLLTTADRSHDTP
jgi:outer membrane receptor protein involved in Fe transport